MLKRYYLLFPALLLSGFSFSQDFFIGIKSGISNTGIYGRFNYKYYNSTQVQYNSTKTISNHIPASEIYSSGFWKPISGISLCYVLNKYICIQSELNYEQQGFDFHCTYGPKPGYEIKTGGVHGYYKVNYLSIPFSFAYATGNKNPFYGYAGISVNRLLSAQNKTIATNPDTTTALAFTVNDRSYVPNEFKKIELSALIGCGIKICLSGKIKLIMDTRYNFGLTKATRNTNYDLWPNSIPNNFQNVFNRSATLCWGVIYKITPKSAPVVPKEKTE